MIFSGTTKKAENDFVFLRFRFACLILNELKVNFKDAINIAIKVLSFTLSKSFLKVPLESIFEIGVIFFQCFCVYANHHLIEICYISSQVTITCSELQIRFLDYCNGCFLECVQSMSPPPPENIRKAEVF